jgi:uncharacterized membrane protein YciS (DUF1049 family)
MALPVLLAIAVGIGLLLSGLVFGVRLASTSRRLRNLRRQVAALQEELDYNRRTANPSRAETASPSPAAGSVSSAGSSESSQFDDLI